MSFVPRRYGITIGPMEFGSRYGICIRCYPWCWSWSCPIKKRSAA